MDEWWRWGDTAGIELEKMLNVVEDEASSEGRISTSRPLSQLPPVLKTPELLHNAVSFF